MQKKDNPESSDEELNESFADHDTDGSGHLTMDEWNIPFDEAVNEMMRTSGEHTANEVPSIPHPKDSLDDRGVLTLNINNSTPITTLSGEHGLVGR